MFKDSTINFDGDHSGGTIVAPSTDKRQSNGIVFLNDTITGNSVHGNTVIDSQDAANVNGPAANSMNLGRPWGWQQVGGDSSAVFINTVMGPAVTKAGYITWNANETVTTNGKNGGNPAEDSRFAEYNSTTDGTTPVDVSERVSWSHQLTASQAAAYTVANIFAPEGTGAGQYPWYGTGYPAADANNPGTGSANPTDPNYSWPAYWGDRNSNNDTTNATVSQTFPTPGNPAGYTNPNWTLAGDMGSRCATRGRAGTGFIECARLWRLGGVLPETTLRLGAVFTSSVPAAICAIAVIRVLLRAPQCHR